MSSETPTSTEQQRPKPSAPPEGSPRLPYVSPAEKAILESPHLPKAPRTRRVSTASLGSGDAVVTPISAHRPSEAIAPVTPEGKGLPDLKDVKDMFASGDILTGDALKASREAVINNPSSDKYAYELMGIAADHGPEAIDKTVEAVKSDFEQRAQTLGIDPAPESKSFSWALWDIAKQSYLAKHPAESNPQDYELGDPIVDRRTPDPELSEKIRRQIVDRRVGWEYAKALAEGTNADIQVDDGTRQSVDAIIEGAKNDGDRPLHSYELSDIGALIALSASKASGRRPRTPDNTPADPPVKPPRKPRNPSGGGTKPTDDVKGQSGLRFAASRTNHEPFNTKGWEPKEYAGNPNPLFRDGTYGKPYGFVEPTPEPAETENGIGHYGEKVLEEGEVASEKLARLIRESKALEKFERTGKQPSRVGETAAERFRSLRQKTAHNFGRLALVDRVKTIGGGKTEPWYAAKAEKAASKSAEQSPDRHNFLRAWYDRLGEVAKRVNAKAPKDAEAIAKRKAERQARHQNRVNKTGDFLLRRSNGANELVERRKQALQRKAERQQLAKIKRAREYVETRQRIERDIEKRRLDRLARLEADEA